MDPLTAFTAAIAPHIRLEHELIGGGMARVFVGEDLRLARRVVVKILSPERAAALDRVRFTREVETIARLQHPNVVPILWSGEEAGLPFFVMPFVAGRSLRVRLQQEGAMAPGQAIPILRDVARALGAAHQAGIVHRDIKPDNILLTPDGAAMVSDFGIAKLLAGQETTANPVITNATMAGTSLGTPTYMAPEQAAADPDTDHRVDLYAFGVVAYEMLAGTPPFRDERPQALLAAHIAKAPEPLSARVPLVPPELEAMVMRCLEKAPSARFAGAGEILTLLETTASSGQVRRITRPARMRRRLAWGAALLATAALGVFAARRFRAPPLDARLIAVAPFRVVMPDSAMAFLRDGLPDLLAAASLTGEGGPRAVEPRTALAAFRAAAGDGDAGALPVPRALDAARDLGAAQLLLGEVLPATQGIELVVTIHDVASRRAGTPVRVSGSRDSLPVLVEALGAKLLTALAGDSVQRGSGLGSVPLPALRAYLEGRSLLRRMQAEDAAKTFLRAIELDSTFALAGIGAAQAGGWFGGTDAQAVGLRVAYTHRDRLGEKDQALLAALLGPRYPAEGLLDPWDRHAAAERYTTIAPERADAWYMLGDTYFHFGRFLDAPDPMATAAKHFRRALAIDSAYVPGYTHLREIATLQGDAALLERIDRLQRAATGNPTPSRIDRWLAARVAGDDAEVERLFTDPGVNTGFYHSVLDYGDYGGIGGDDGWRAGRTLLQYAPTAEIRRGLVPYIARVALYGGRLAAADTLYAEQAAIDPIEAARSRIMGGVAVGLPAAAFEPWRRTLETAFAAGNMPRPRRRVVGRALLMEAIATERREAVVALLPQVIPLEHPSPEDSVARPSALPLLARAWLAARKGPPDAAVLAPVDSAMRHWRSTGDAQLGSAIAAVLADLHARRGDHRAAMFAAARRAERNGDLAWASTPLRRLEGIHAAQAGDTVRARVALTAYLAWRRGADPALHAERAEVERLLAALGGPLAIRDMPKDTTR